MLKMSVYTVFDSKADVYSTPVFSMNDDVARRDFKIAANSEESQIFHNPADYTLCRIGEWNASKGLLEAYDRVVICNGVDVKVKE